jgi:hypothetical protein
MTNYRVSKAQSLRMRAFDKKVEAAEAKKAKAAEKQTKADEKESTGGQSSQNVTLSAGEVE